MIPLSAACPFSMMPDRDRTKREMSTRMMGELVYRLIENGKAKLFSIAGWRGQSPSTTVSTAGSLSSTVARSDGATGLEEVKGTGVVSLGSEPNSTTTLPETQNQGRPYIRFLIRAHSGMTSTLHRRLLSSPSSSSLETSVYTEGPYAGHRAALQPLFIADTVLCIVGGIGITNILGFVQEYSNANHRSGATSGKSQRIMRKAKRFILAWSAREMALIEHVKQNFLLPKDEVDGIEYSFWCTGSSDTGELKVGAVHEEGQKDEGVALTTPAAITAGRMDIRSVMRSHMETGQQMTVMVCGPGNMADEATRQVIDCLKGGFKVNIVEESYTW